MEGFINLVHAGMDGGEGVQAVDRGGMCAGVAVGALRDPGAGRLHGPRCKGTYVRRRPSLFLTPELFRRSSWPGHSEQTNHASNGKDRHANGTRDSGLRAFCSYVRVFL